MFEAIVKSEDLLGECPIWCPRTHRLLWTNIMRNELLAYQPQSGTNARWLMPERLGSFALTARQDVLLLGLESRLAFFNMATGELRQIGASPGNPNTRIGDGRCDRVGNFVFGTMHEGEPQERVGAFYRLNAETMTIESLALPAVAIANGICFSPDGTTMYYCDSLQPHIFCCDYPSLENMRTFSNVTGGGAPDGSCVDADCFLWNAEWGGSRVVRYSPNGRVDRVISARATQTTCPVIGGHSGDMLFCTSARAGLSSPNDADGALLGINVPGISAIPETCFAGQERIEFVWRNEEKYWVGDFPKAFLNIEYRDQPGGWRIRVRGGILAGEIPIISRTSGVMANVQHLPGISATEARSMPGLLQLATAVPGLILAAVLRGMNDQRGAAALSGVATN